MMCLFVNVVLFSLLAQMIAATDSPISSSAAAASVDDNSLYRHAMMASGSYSTVSHSTRRAFSGYCTNTNSPYATSVISSYQNYNSSGAAASYYLNYNTAPTDATFVTDRNPNVATTLHFNRIENTVRLESSLGLIIPDYTITMGPATREYPPGVWTDYILVEWNFRLVTPCTGIYQFSISGDDGVELWIENQTVPVFSSQTKAPWSAHSELTYDTVGVNMTQNTIYRARFIYYEHEDRSVANLRWKIPGETTFEDIGTQFLIPFQAPRVYLSSGSTVSFRSTTGTEMMEVRLSDPPQGTVTVTIDNSAGAGLFGFDVCTLAFTPTDWYIPQRVYVAPLPGAKALPTTPVVPVSFNAASTSSSEEFASGLLQVLYETGVNGTNTGGKYNLLCRGTGDPHYHTWDEQTFDFQKQGTFYLALSVDGTFAVMTILRRCDANNPTTVACTKMVYVKYRSAFYQIFMNQTDTEEGIMDKTVYVAKLGGDEEGLVLSRASNSDVTFDMQKDGVSVQVKFDYSRAWLPNKSDWWRLFDVFVYTSEGNSNKLTGLCGNANGNAGDDVSDSDSLFNSWSVPNTVNMLDGSGINVIDSSMTLGYSPGGSYTYQYATDKSLTSFDPVCSGSNAPVASSNEAMGVLSASFALSIPPINETGYTSDAPPPNSTDFPLIYTFVKSLFSLQTCVPVNQSNPDYSSLVSNTRSAAFIDLVNAMGFFDNTPPPEAADSVTSPFNVQCQNIQESDRVLQCNCTGTQTCNMGVCQDTPLGCGGECLGSTSYCNGTVCICESGRTGPNCEVILSATSALTLEFFQGCGPYAVPIYILPGPISGPPTIDSTPESCLCPSQYSNAFCTDLTTATNCASKDTVQNTTYTGQQLIVDGINGGTINSGADSVEFTINSPQVVSRRYIGFDWGNCKNNATTTNWALAKYQHSTVRDSCNDTFAFGYRVANLVSECGLNISYMDYNNGNPFESVDWVRYRGDHHIYYEELVTVLLDNSTGTTKTLTRIGRLTTPIDVYIQRNYSSSTRLVVDEIDIYSPMQLKAAITATTIKASTSTALVSVTFAISDPYEIICISNRKSSGGEYVPGLAVTPNDVSAYAVDNNDNVLTTVQQVCQNSNAGISPCLSPDYDDNNLCWRTVDFILILNSGVCSLSHTVLIDQITVDCNQKYAGIDCPIQGPDTTSSLQFTVNANQFCDGQRAVIIDDAIVIKSYVPQQNRSRTDDTPFRAALKGQDRYLTLFIDTLQSLKVYAMTVLSADAGGFQTKVSYTPYNTPNAAIQYIDNVNTNANGDGFDLATQTHSMKITLDCDTFQADGTLGATNRNCLIDNAGGTLSTKLTFYMDYESARRRRQVSQSRGYASMTTDMSFTPIETQSQVNNDSSAAIASLRSLHRNVLLITFAATLVMLI